MTDLNGVHAQLSVSPSKECPLRRLTATYNVRTVVPATEETPPQVLVRTDDASVPECEPVLTTLAQPDEITICTLDTDRDHVDNGLCPGHCLAEGVPELPRQPYERAWDGPRLRLLFAFEDKDALTECIEAFEQRGYDPTLERIGTGADSERSELVLIDLGVLTPRQREVARHAIQRGYYSADGDTAAELADDLGITKTTLSEHLRTVREKIGRQLFTDAGVPVDD